VVERYPVDGIQLDDHFGLPIEFGYDAYTQELYRQDHGGQAPPPNPADPNWVAWRADRMTLLMERIAASVKAVNPDAIVSLSPNPPAFAYNKYLQDWTRWISLGLLDEVVVQVYRDDLTALEATLYDGGFRGLNEQVPISIGLYTGPPGQAKSVEQMQQEVAAVQGADYRGVAFFCWETTLWVFKGSPSETVYNLLTTQLPRAEFRRQ
ncbi:MAG: family 10 glycosylhydrolase, partial [Cyanobacteria bacterium P01_H01_bin.58]